MIFFVLGLTERASSVEKTKGRMLLEYFPALPRASARGWACPSLSPDEMTVAYGLTIARNFSVKSAEP